MILWALSLTRNFNTFFEGNLLIVREEGQTLKEPIEILGSAMQAQVANGVRIIHG
jgi:hypothetical protein